MSKEAEILFTGKMNSDDEERLIPFGDYRDALYLRSGTAESQNAGAKETYKGNALKDLGEDFLPAGANTLIGSCPDTKRKAIILFFHNSNNIHSIVLMDTITEAYTIILQGDLGFDIDYPIVDAGVIGDILKYTDGKDSSAFWVAGVRQFNPMMGFNVEKAMDGFYTTVDLQSIEVLKYPPMLAPTAVYGTAEGVSNRIRQGLYEFRAAYISTDNEATTLSAVSDMPMKNTDEWVQGIDYANPFNDNYITVTIDSGHYTIRKIRLYVRTNSGLWYLIHEADKDIEGIADNVPYSFDFYNDIIFTPVGFVTPDNDNVPQTALRQEITQAKSSSEVIYGDYFTGYDNVEVDYTLSHVPIEITDFKADYANLFALGANDWSGVEGRITIAADSYARFDFSAGDTFSLSVNITTPALGNVLLTYALTQADIEFALALSPVATQVEAIIIRICDGWAAQMNALNGVDFLTTTGGGGSYSIIALNYAFQPFQVTVFNRNVISPVIPTRRTGVKRSLKKGWTYYVALQYMDRGKRNGTVQKRTSEYILKTPWPSEEEARASFSDPNSPYYLQLKVLIDSLPPIWATHYSIVVKKVRASFEQRSSISIVKDPTTNLLMISLENQSTKSNGEMISHQIQVGDIVRFVTMNYPNDLLSNAKYTNDYIETQVVKYDPTGGVGGTECIWVYLFETGSIIDGSPTNSNSQLLEIYTQTKQVDQTDDSPWFEIMTAAIGSPHTADAYHTSLQGQTTGTFTSTGILNDNHLNLDGDYSAWVGAYLYGPNFGDGAGPFSGIITSAVYDGVSVTYVEVDGAQFGTFVSDNAFTATYNQVVTSGVSVSGANIIPDWGDVWFRQRDMGTGWSGALATHCYYYVEDPSYSGYYKSDYYGLGRPAVERTNNERIRQSEGVIHSQTFLEDTLINGLSNFNGLDNFKQLSEKDGPITRLIADGQTLHVIQEQCTTPIYRGVNTTDASGETTNLAFTTNTFGAIGKARPCGSIHPLSIQKIDGIIFGYDYFRGKVFILTNEDDYDICEGQFKMKNYITTKTQYVRDNFAQMKIISFVDEANKEYVLNFADTLTDEDEGIVFKYTEKRWTHRITYPVRWAENLGTYLISSNGTNIWRHNEGNQLEFYGTIYEASLTFSFNAEPALIKRPLAFCQKTNSVWEVPEIVVSSSTNYPTGMTSMIPASEFKPLEDYLHSAYLNDSSNVVAAIPDLVDTAHALINGRNLIGPSMLHTMTITPSEKVVLFSVKIIYDLSLPLK